MSMFAGWWWPALILMGICMAMMFGMMGHGSHRSPMGRAPHGQRAGQAERILADRMARGEIDIEEYERRLAALRKAAPQGQRAGPNLGE